MANRIVSVHAGIYGMGIYAIMLPSSGFSVAYWMETIVSKQSEQISSDLSTDWLPSDSVITEQWDAGFTQCFLKKEM